MASTGGLATNKYSLWADSSWLTENTCDLHAGVSGCIGVGEAIPQKHFLLNFGRLGMNVFNGHHFPMEMRWTHRGVEDRLQKSRRNRQGGVRLASSLTLGFERGGHWWNHLQISRQWWEVRCHRHFGTSTMCYVKELRELRFLVSFAGKATSDFGTILSKTHELSPLLYCILQVLLHLFDSSVHPENGPWGTFVIMILKWIVIKKNPAKIEWKKCGLFAGGYFV